MVVDPKPGGYAVAACLGTSLLCKWIEEKLGGMNLPMEHRRRLQEQPLPTAPDPR